MNKQLKFIAAMIMALAILYFGGQFASNNQVQGEVKQPQISAEELLDSGEVVIDERFVNKTNAQVIRVVDGDTLIAEFDNEPGVEQKIRLLGVNTPETVDPRKAVECFGKEASSFAKTLLNNKRIWLEPDPEADNIDKYGRLLRNLYLESGMDFNATLVARGYAYAYLSFPLATERKTELRKIETKAKEAGVGLWSDESCSGEK